LIHINIVVKRLALKQKRERDTKVSEKRENNATELEKSAAAYIHHCWGGQKSGEAAPHQLGTQSPLLSSFSVSFLHMQPSLLSSSWQ
jgi:hypothetical protein